MLSKLTVNGDAIDPDDTFRRPTWISAVPAAWLLRQDSGRTSTAQGATVNATWASLTVTDQGVGCEAFALARNVWLPGANERLSVA